LARQVFEWTSSTFLLRGTRKGGAWRVTSVFEMGSETLKKVFRVVQMQVWKVSPD